MSSGSYGRAPRASVAPLQATFAPADRAADDAPLATRMRPRTLDELVGQAHLLGPGRALRRAIEGDRLTSVILWGPPGSGKTTLAAVIAQHTRAHVVAVSAVAASVADVRRAAEEARQLRPLGRRTILFIDEIHRFNRAQQDAVLPSVETGLLTLIGATTENPSFEVNGALLSRSRVYRLEALRDEDVAALVERAITDAERGLGMFHVKLGGDALERLVALSGGDARVALNTLELAVLGSDPDAEAVRHVDAAAIEEALQRRGLRYDRAGDEHYDVISAFIKSMRGSDPDAAVYWLARLLEAGEDPLFVARRMVIFAAEDVGLADPGALSVAVAAQQAAHFVGMPEALFPLSEAALYLARAPKSNSVKAAYAAAADEVRRSGSPPVPLHLRNPTTELTRAMGHGAAYKYPHDYAGHVVEQAYLPSELGERRFYAPSGQGEERARDQE